MEFLDQGFGGGAGSSRSSKKARCPYTNYDGQDMRVENISFQTCLDDRPAVVKMDIETMDLDILERASQYDWHDVRLLLVEFSTQECRDREEEKQGSGISTFLRILQELRGAGFTHCHYPRAMERKDHWKPDAFRKGYDDVLFFYRQGADKRALAQKSRVEYESRADWQYLPKLLK